MSKYLTSDNIFFAVIVFFGMLGILYLAASTPTVYESYATGECVKVEDPTNRYSCENLPPKYNQRWVQ